VKPKKLRVPATIHHKASNQDVVFLRAADGQRHMVYLGEHDSADAARRYREVLADHLAGEPVATSSKPKAVSSEWPTVAQLVAAFLLWAEKYYVDADGRRSLGVVNFVHAFRPFLKLMRDLPTDQITIPGLCEVRQAIIDHGKCNRTTINSKLRRVRQCVRWGVEMRMVPGSVWHEVSAMKGLPIGRAGVRESRIVEPVQWAEVKAILPHLHTPLRAAVELQWWCGARPSEILQLTRSRLDMSGKVWLFRPPLHKGVWQGKERVIPIGPRGQGVLRPLLKLDAEAAILSPRDALAEIKAEKRENRKSPVTPSQRARDERNAAKEPPVGEFYDVNTYRKAIHRACDRAGVLRWSPHRLRHACGTRIVHEEGLEAGEAALGHADDRVTRRYSITAKSALAVEIARRHG
jgi:integrase